MLFFGKYFLLISKPAKNLTKTIIYLYLHNIYSKKNAGETVNLEQGIFCFTIISFSILEHLNN